MLIVSFIDSSRTLIFSTRGSQLYALIKPVQKHVMLRPFQQHTFENAKIRE